jgi:hypothetical protein
MAKHVAKIGNSELHTTFVLKHDGKKSRYRSRYRWDMRVEKDVSGSELGPVAGYCRGGNYFLGFIKGGASHFQLRDMELLMQVSASWISVVTDRILPVCWF